MNWYRTAQLKETLPYFQEFEEEGDYIPDEESINVILKNQFNASIVKDIGQGDSGVAYLLSNGDVLKITTNSQEGEIAKYISENPNPSMADYKLVWKEGDLYYIIMEKINNMAINYPYVEQQFRNLEPLMERNNIRDPVSLYEFIKKNNIMNLEFRNMLLSYLFYIQNLAFKIFDFININNVGIKNGKLIFFDVT